ncbi:MULTISPECIES: hypothetical protein [unclassified Bradyrhizobium]|uniref:hypothetical protein n=1 Tax=unclassified Bradyrhizobium TaxID=2631580 RepID=UPI002479F1DF|nr:MULTISPECIES: hypothetical protein [unclassified Bradyrhizobium]WGR68526.1 hypothetical protein MTX24_24185 [Bradyrhizobium sp. ISRA426]WGR80581.1 hypothetical protein MTX21_09300 [Bradyrhizobium sp. ISRA430]WGR83766.1 hypothetical protein MTX25_23865 [Bradyrhizobium sp. ISRA432]
MSSKQPKLYAPSGKDLRDNPLIGGSKGASMAGASPDDVEDAFGENTIEGDFENDVNVAGGIDKDVARSGSHRRGR